MLLDLKKYIYKYYTFGAKHFKFLLLFQVLFMPFILFSIKLLLFYNLESWALIISSSLIVELILYFLFVVYYKTFINLIHLLLFHFILKFNKTIYKKALFLIKLFKKRFFLVVFLIFWWFIVLGGAFLNIYSNMFPRSRYYNILQEFRFILIGFYSNNIFYNYFSLNYFNLFLFL